MPHKIIYFWRIYFLIFFLLVGLSGLTWRIIYLGTTKRIFLEKQSAARSLRITKHIAHRGIIYDRNGIPLAISIPVESIWASPTLYKADAQEEKELSKLLKIPITKLRKKITTATLHNKAFLYLKRRLPAKEATEIRSLHIPGIFTQEEYQRYYPEGEITAHLLGFTNIDDNGVEGLELAYDKWLKGIPGKKEVTKDRLGNIVDELRVIKEPQDGHNLMLSLDRNIQYLAYRELQNTIEKFHAEAGSVVVLDIKTNEVLAIVNQPSYNPNARSKKPSALLRNCAVTDTFEPGSTMKLFSMASALESGKYNPSSRINTCPGWWMIGSNRITDDTKCGNLTVADILKKSSDVGAAKITLSLPADRLLNLLRRFGFGESTYSGFPGEASGSLPSNIENHSFVLATLAFGYSISATPLQLARAYAALANDGYLRPVTFLKMKELMPGQQVLNTKLSARILTMLESVIKEGGTGSLAKIAGYRIAGKTGTAYIAEHGGYAKNHMFSTFAGIAPKSRPRLAIVVAIKNPKEQYLGGIVAAPTFANIMAGALRILNVPPDNLPKTANNKKQTFALVK